MPEDSSSSPWDFASAISLLSSFALPRFDATPQPPDRHDEDRLQSRSGNGLGDFSDVWDFLERPYTPDDGSYKAYLYDCTNKTFETDDLQPGRGIRWRDEVDGADLEDNIEPEPLTAASARTQKRAERRVRARERLEKSTVRTSAVSDTETNPDSGEELESLRRSPDRRAIIQALLNRKKPDPADSPPTSPSPPKAQLRAQDKWPTANPYLYTAPGALSPYRSLVIVPRDGLTSRGRKEALISKLKEKCSEESKYLKNKGLITPQFSALNVSNIGVHVFIDISNISIGFHDCLKMGRGMTRDARVKRVPLDFHNFSLVLERGRPAAKRVLVGSDKVPAIEQARSLGYETNILERVHKAKELTPRQKKYLPRSGGETSGSETNTGLDNHRAEKWVEQAVDEILHLKILESLIDYSDKPSTIVLATGDAAVAEYSDGFLKMVERALAKGWMVELVSFKLNTSSLYKRREFRTKWGQMFRWIQLDDYAEMLIAAEDS